jgi:type III restriction enzyme
MPQKVIENPILNSPFEEPLRHFKFDDEGITNEISESRRDSMYFVPIPRSKKRGGQTEFETEWTQDRIEENKAVNRIRQRVAIWRKGGHTGVTPVTLRLLQYWSNPEREKKLFFCQIEALETAIYITEVARKYGDAWMENHLREANDQANPGLPRIALKMATGTGKTVVMGMLIAWQALNKFASPQDARFSDTFLIVSPGITIRDRLRVLLPNDPGNYYRQRNILPGNQIEELTRAKILITNYHAFQLRETVDAGKLTKAILAQGNDSAFKESPAEMVRRVCRELGNKKNVVVLNDEAHHCYRRKPDGYVETEPVLLKGDDRKEAEKRNEEARVWISGLEAVREKIGIRYIYDLSATPFFLRGSGYSEGTLFPWVVSDFSLVDAIESGIVKIPRVPVADNSMVGDSPTYRDLWYRIRERLPRKGRGTDAVSGEPKLPGELEGALQSLYSNYEQYYRRWEKDAGAVARGQTPPVFIVVCNNTNVSKLVYDYISGWEKPVGDQNLAQVGSLNLFRNDDGHGGWLHRPNTILVDSEQLESGDGMSDDFKKIAAREIEEFKNEYRLRFPDRDVDNLTDEDLLREVMNTVGKSGKLGEHVKCVVSVSMLTEGWDANTVTHVLGVRAFGTQLLCEQVVGRALRRMSYDVGADGHFSPEYAEVYGVPFSFIPCSGGPTPPPPQNPSTRVRALDARATCEINFPRLLGYRYDLGEERLRAKFDTDDKLILDTRDVPTKTENAPIVGELSIHTLDELRRRRLNEVAFELGRRTLTKYFGEEENKRPWLFPSILGITKQWLAEYVVCHDQAFPQLLLIAENSHRAADKIYHAIVRGERDSSTPRLLPILAPYDTLGSTKLVDFDTRRPTYQTHADRCHVSHVVADTDSWEQKLAQTLEDMPEVLRYVKNDHLGFTIPYSNNGEEHLYYPDFIAVLNDGHGKDNPLNLILEVTGEKKKDKEAKVTTAKALWVPAVNNHDDFGRWDFIEIRDPWNAESEIRKKLRATPVTA